MSEPAWRAGFEVEVILGSFDPEFAYHYDDPMDRASSRFCQAVARELRFQTGRKWSAPNNPKRSPGFYVLSEYDLDPLHWPVGRVAGVELLTPPLPFDEAEKVRREIIDAIEEFDGGFNSEPSDAVESCAWHINIDSGPDGGLAPSDFMLGCDELSILAANGRLFSKYAAPQRASYGRALLRHLRTDPDGSVLKMAPFANFLGRKA